MSIPSVIERWPTLDGRLWHQPLGSLPTSVRPLPALSRRCGVEVWVKADDGSGELYGGNKVRKLEVLLPRARAQGAGAVLTAGGVGSHHVLATALYAKRLGLTTHAFLYPQPLTPHTLEVLRAIGATCERLTLTPSYLCLPVEAVRALARGIDPGLFRGAAIIPPGGSDPWGTLGYVGAGLELASQIAGGALPLPSALVAALGSGGTVAGLLLGLAAAGLPTEVLAVRVTPAAVANRATVRRLVRLTADLLRRLGAEPPEVGEAMGRLRLVTEEAGAGYGHPTPAARRAVEWAGEDAMHLETTYTGKALAGLLRAARGVKGPLLFWNTFSSADLRWLDEGWPGLSHLPEEIQRWVGEVSSETR